MPTPNSVIEVTLSGFNLCVCRYGRLEECIRHFGGCSERIDAATDARQAILAERDWLSQGEPGRQPPGGNTMLERGSGDADCNQD